MKKRKGFTLIELMVVVIVVGILAALGTGNYLRVVEKSRGAEARKVLGMIRNQMWAYYMENNKFTSDLAQLQMSALPTGTCDTQYYFKYSCGSGGVTYNITAIRCTTGESGKNPGWIESYMINLTELGSWAYNNTKYV